MCGERSSTLQWAPTTMAQNIHDIWGHLCFAYLWSVPISWVWIKSDRRPRLFISPAPHNRPHNLSVAQPAADPSQQETSNGGGDLWTRPPASARPRPLPRVGVHVVAKECERQQKRQQHQHDYMCRYYYRQDSSQCNSCRSRCCGCVFLLLFVAVAGIVPRSIHAHLFPSSFPVVVPIRFVGRSRSRCSKVSTFQGRDYC